jgi:hypothetical protein
MGSFLQIVSMDILIKQSAAGGLVKELRLYSSRDIGCIT